MQRKVERTLSLAERKRLIALRAGRSGEPPPAGRARVARAQAPRAAAIVRRR